LPGVGPATAARILERISQTSDALNGLKTFTPPGPTAEPWPAFVETFGLLHQHPSWPSDIEAVCRWY
jgi:DNA helicase-2/ATP-dependent DNA helicase PcrA